MHRHSSIIKKNKKLRGRWGIIEGVGGSRRKCEQNALYSTCNYQKCEQKKGR